MNEIDIINIIREFGTFKQVKQKYRNTQKYWTMEIFICGKLIYNTSTNPYKLNTKPLDNENFKEWCIKDLHNTIIAQPSFKVVLEKIIEPLAKFNLL